MSSPYKDTLLLPQTDFPMRGNLVTREPQRLEAWEKAGLYQKVLTRRRAKKAPKFILHDGPPFANGEVHMGTALNKILKDMVAKSKTMAGYEVPFVPGWDCHGLPIEFKVLQDARGEEPAEVRRRCEAFAREWIEVQRTSFRRLGIFGDWGNPYLTLDKTYEADVLRTFAHLVEQGIVYQSQKPVSWSYGAQTALAEAEIEYQDKTSVAVFVSFALDPIHELKDFSVVIWTTTPWTLPANLAIAVHERLLYTAGNFEREGVTRKLIIAQDLLESVAEKTGWKLVSEEKTLTLTGAELAGTQARHPFLDRKIPIITAAFVTTESGTGAVHIAPGHGMDDYLAGQQNGLEVLSPVDAEGKFTDECGLAELVGKHVFKSNNRIVEILEERDSLLGKENYQHSYPHCWRSKTPIIFRAVEQFFISLNGLREKALAEIDKVTWLPKWGKNRIRGTVETRPDWCISRQRTWGVPLPVFYDPAGEAILKPEVIHEIAALVEKEGTNVWFEKSDAELVAELSLPVGSRKGKDTLDVWIDSGCSHAAVLDRHPELNRPADLYLEATDQHRGWFQSSLMLSAATQGSAPYRTVMTHGFVIDQDTGKKTSKSEAKKSGKPTDAAHFYDKYGADIVRLWVSSVDWQNEVPFGEDLFKQITEPYRRLRNTFRILLGNLHGYESERDAVLPTDMPLVDRWILERLESVKRDCLAAYAAFDFRKSFTVLNQFCTQDLSALYIDLTKDRMYCDAADSLRRRSTQTALAEIFDCLAKLLAPILVYTADEAWEASGQTGSIHEQDFPMPNKQFSGNDATKQVDELLEIRSVVQTAIEAQVQAKVFQKNNEAKVRLTVPAQTKVQALLEDREFATEFFILADLIVEEGESLSARAEKSEHPMCPRCRRYEPVHSADLCQRCAQTLA